jgi:hypothetical protein
MAGSKRYFKYITDTGTAHSIYADESNGEALIGDDDTPLLPNRDLNFPSLPKGLQMRFVRAISQDAFRRDRKFVVGDPQTIRDNGDAEFITAPVYPGGPPVQWLLTCYRGEQFKYTPPVNTSGGDTGLNDGDQGSDQE